MPLVSISVRVYISMSNESWLLRARSKAVIELCSVVCNKLVVLQDNTCSRLTDIHVQVSVTRRLAQVSLERVSPA